MNHPSTNQKQPKLKIHGWRWSILVIITSIFFLNYYFQWYPLPSHEKSLRAKEHPATEPKLENIDIDQSKQGLIMDYEKIKSNSDPDKKNIVEKRKKELGLDKSVDMIVKPGEFIRINKQTIPLNQILAEIKAYQKVQTVSTDTLKLKTLYSDRGKDETESSVNPVQSKQKIDKSDLKAQDELEIESHFATMIHSTEPKKQSTSYGIYLTRNGDNLWNIHFTFLREYFSARGIKISTIADEPLGDQSSGVGRILKYAEEMVYVFNLKTKKLSKDINFLKPLEKIVIFNVSKLHNVLGSLSEGQLNSIHFDGHDLKIPG